MTLLANPEFGFRDSTSSVARPMFVQYLLHSLQGGIEYPTYVYTTDLEYKAIIRYPQH